MADKIKDEEDRLLESMFASAAVADDGFSVQIVRKVRQRIWMRRLIVPVASTIGALIAFKPVAGLVSALAGLSSLIPQDLVTAAAGSLPQLQIIVLGVILLAAGLLGIRMLED